jgi:Cytotoxic
LLSFAKLDFLDAAYRQLWSAETGSVQPEKPPKVGHLYPAPKTLPAFPMASSAKPKTRVGRGAALRKRWKEPDVTIYEWDYQHGTVEKYDSKGNHQGEFDYLNGARLKSANPARRVEP